MPTEIENVIADFCELSKKKKALQYSEYQTKLRMAYQGETSLYLPVNERGLEEEGGRLLGWFFEQYTHIEEVYLKSAMLNEYDGRRLTSGVGFDALIEGLKHLKKLRVLDLSEDRYTPEQLGKLTKDVLMNHPAFTTLTLMTTSITDIHLDAITEHLSCPQLKRIHLNSNDRYLTGEAGAFERLVDKLLSSCPSIQFIDLSGNSTIKSGSSATDALMRLVMMNTKAFVRIPQDEAVYQQSMKNRYERFIPSQFALMDMGHNKIRTQFEEFKTTMEGVFGLMATLRAHETRLVQVDARIEEMQAQNEQVQQQIQDAIALQCLKQILIEHQIKQIHADVREFKVDIGSMKERLLGTESHVRELESRVEGFATTVSHMSEGIGALKRSLARQVDVSEDLNERMEQKLDEFRNLFDRLEQRMQERFASMIVSIGAEEDIAGGPIEQAYIKKFKYLLVQIHIVAMTATEGTMQLGSSNTASMALMVLNILSSMAPNPIGTPVQLVFGYLIQSMDERNTTQRMEKIAELGAEPADVARLALTLSQRLIHCFTLAHYVKKGSLAKLLSITEDTMRLFTENGFYGALFHTVQDTNALTPLTSAVTRALTIPEVEKRAEQDAKLLLAAVVKEGVPKGIDAVTIDANRLFLYASPMLTIIDRLFFTILQNFCTTERCELNTLSIKAEKRQQFYGRVAKSWHDRADVVSTQIEKSPDAFVEKLATTYSKKTHPDGSVGIFYFKTPQTIFHMNQKRHVSIRNQALDAREVEEALSQTLISAV